MAETLCTMDTELRGKVTCAQIDYYGRRLACGDGNGMIKLFDFSDVTQPKTLVELKEHSGPINSLAWAHPRFQNIIASAGYDRKLILYKEQANNQWSVCYSDDITKDKPHPGSENCFQGSVNKLVFAPFKRGLVVAAAGSDGTVGILQYTQDRFHRSSFPAHPAGVLSLAWSPCPILDQAGHEIPNSSTDTIEKAQICTGGIDGGLKIFTNNGGQWSYSEKLESNHGGKWVTCIGWRDKTNEGGVVLIASGGEDGHVLFHTKVNDTQWKLVGKINPSNQSPPLPVSNLEFSESGTQILISYSDNKTILYKEVLNNSLSSTGPGQSQVGKPVEFIPVHSMDETGIDGGVTANGNSSPTQEQRGAPQNQIQNQMNTSMNGTVLDQSQGGDTQSNANSNGPMNQSMNQMQSQQPNMPTPTSMGMQQQQPMSGQHQQQGFPPQQVQQQPQPGQQQQMQMPPQQQPNGFPTSPQPQQHQQPPPVPGAFAAPPPTGDFAPPPAAASAFGAPPPMMPGGGKGGPWG